MNTDWDELVVRLCTGAWTDRRDVAVDALAAMSAGERPPLAAVHRLIGQLPAIAPIQMSVVVRLIATQLPDAQAEFHEVLGSMVSRLETSTPESRVELYQLVAIAECSAEHVGLDIGPVWDALANCLVHPSEELRERAASRVPFLLWLSPDFEQQVVRVADRLGSMAPLAYCIEYAAVRGVDVAFAEDQMERAISGPHGSAARAAVLISRLRRGAADDALDVVREDPELCEMAVSSALADAVYPDPASALSFSAGCALLGGGVATASAEALHNMIARQVDVAPAIDAFGEALREHAPGPGRPATNIALALGHALADERARPRARIALNSLMDDGGRRAYMSVLGCTYGAALRGDWDTVRELALEHDPDARAGVPEGLASAYAGRTRRLHPNACAPPFGTLRELLEDLERDEHPSVRERATQALIDVQPRRNAQ